MQRGVAASVCQCHVGVGLEQQLADLALAELAGEQKWRELTPIAHVDEALIGNGERHVDEQLEHVEVGVHDGQVHGRVALLVLHVEQKALRLEQLVEGARGGEAQQCLASPVRQRIHLLECDHVIINRQSITTQLEKSNHNKTNKPFRCTGRD